MEITAHFSDIRKIIIQEVESATEEILIAVAWFTNEQLFDALINKLMQTNSQLMVKLIIINDTINIKPIGLDFQKFIDYGGILYFGNYENPMHNKYCIIDKKTVISGSYNYTYLAEQINEENVIKIKGVSDVINSYDDNFKILLKDKYAIANLKKHLKTNPPHESMLSIRSYGVKDVFQQAVELNNTKRVEEAKRITEYLNLLPSHTPTDQFEINEVVYRQWKQNYYVDKVVVSRTKVILHFKTIGKEVSCIYGSNTRNSWLIRDSSNVKLYSKVIKITNIAMNGNVIIKKTNPNALYYCAKDSQSISQASVPGYKQNSSNSIVSDDGIEVPVVLIPVEGTYELRCELHFAVTQFDLKIIDLIEGLGMDEKENHWHCFDINLYLNRQSIS